MRLRGVVEVYLSEASCNGLMRFGGLLFGNDEILNGFYSYLS